MFQRAANWRTRLRAGLPRAVLVLICAWSGMAWSSDEDYAVPGYFKKTWTTEQGAPSYIRAIEQSPEGFLWLGSSTGLYKFDGVTFTRFETPLDATLPVGSVVALANGQDGDLWVVIANREIIRLKNDQIVFRQPLPDTLGSIHSFVPDGYGRLVLVSTSGLFELQNSAWVSVPTPGLTKGAQIQDAFFAKDGTSWLATGEGVYSKAKQEKTYQLRDGRHSGGGKFAQLNDESVWFCSENAGLSEFDALGKLQISNERLLCYYLFIDTRGFAWITGPGGSGVAEPKAWIGKSEGEIKSGLVIGTFGREIVYSFLQDKEGSIWIGSTGGLSQFWPNRFTEKPGVQGNGGIAPAAGGGLWVISYSRGLMRITDRVVSYAEAGKALTYITRDRTGIVWIGSHRRGVLLRIENGVIREVPFPPGQTDAFVNGIGVESDGSPWVSTYPAPSGSIYRYIKGAWVEHGGLAGLPKKPPSTLFVDGADNVWLGYPQSQLILISKNKVIALPGMQEMNMGNIRSIIQYENSLIFAGDGGLAVLDGGTFHKIALIPPATLLGVSNILRTRNGDLWVNQPSNSVRIPVESVRRAIKRSEPVSAEVFDYRDGRIGPPNSIAPIPTLAQTDDGRLWVSAINLSSINPTQIKRNEVLPKVGFRFFAIDGVKRRVDGRPIELEHDTKEIIIGFMSSSLAVPDRVQYHYKMEGVDTRWRPGNEQREATYTQLRPGSYVFKVIASNNDGLWSLPQSLKVVVRPAYYQTGWFAALCLIIFFVLVGILVRVRTRFLADRIRDRLEERSRERERIARELHDTLLQGIQGLILQFHLIADDLPPDDESRKLMEGALDRADRLMSEGRQRVSDLRLQEVGASLGASLQRQLADEEMSPRPHVRCREWNRARTLAPVVQTELLRIAHEAVSNALRHGGCKHIGLVIRYDIDALRMRIRDDGCGISADHAKLGKPGHWGITGMQERARNIGAQIRIAAGKIGGTVVDISVPASMAYARRRPTSWRQALWR